MNFVRVALVLAAAFALTAGESPASPLGLLFAPPDRLPATTTWAGTDWRAASQIEGDRGDYHELSLAAGLRQRLWRGERFQLFVDAGVVQHELGDRPIFPETGTRLPAAFQELGVGVSALHLFEGPWAASWRLGLRSVSDEPFSSRDEAKLTGEFVMRRVFPEGDLLILGLASDSVSQVPIPFVAWSTRPSPGLMLTLGLPVARLQWTPSEDWRLGAQVSPGGVGGEVAWSPRRSWWLRAFTASAGWSELRPVDREDDDLSIDFREQRVGLELSWKPWPGADLALGAGWAFSRRLRESDFRRFWDAWSSDSYEAKIDIDDGFWSALTLSIPF